MLDSAPEPPANCRRSPGENCRCASQGVTRQEFLQTSGATALAWLAGPALSGPAMAGPFETSDFEKLVPADKKLDPAWVRSLFDRGEPAVYGGEALKFIGMPIGGICAGQLYLGGDGRLWHWDIFNQHVGTGAEHYAKPLAAASPVEQGFSLRVGGEVRPLASGGFSEITFRGAYPLGTVEYREPGLPVTVRLEAFSPFIPLNTDDSSLPATVLQFRLHNTGTAEVEVELVGQLENAVCLHHREVPGVRRNQVVRGEGFSFLSGTAEPPATAEATTPDIVFENWQRETYAPWSAEGKAFGAGPVERKAIPSYQGDVGGEGPRLVNSHATAPGDAVDEKDRHTGKLTSQAFTVERHYLHLWIGGGSHAGKTCVNVLVEGKPVRSATGRNDNRMHLHSLDMRPWRGQQAVLEIVDAESGPWGNVGVGTITLSDRPALAGELDRLSDFGSLGLALLGRPAEISSVPGTAALSEKLVGQLGRKLTLAPGAEAQVVFVLAWHFPNLALKEGGRHYAEKFESALAVARYVASNFERLARETRLWHDTWYDSTLPYWLLDRTFLNTSILATSTCHRFRSGRFWGWEGVGCCEGTCTHVWQYAQAVARLFPELERDLRERTDLGLAFEPATGIIKFRGDAGPRLAVDGQAGCILRAYREHQMSATSEFLQRNWPRIKQAMQCLIEKDANGDGLIEDGQHNTLDADWYGPVAWLSGLYLAALRASEQMAGEQGDAAFAAHCRRILERGQKNLVERLFDQEYFINRPDPQRADTINSGTGCEIDQVLGQCWAWQVGLGRVLPEQETRAALRSLWRYNFAPNVGPYRTANKLGRWYAMPGEAGLLMCTFPRADWNFKQAAGKGPEWAVGYFNECMNGFEYQVAGHMLWEGMVQEGLAITRAIHDRYHPARRNPWNEVECGDHYARSMASYGVFLAACGFEYHGPKRTLAFAPRLSPENFRAAFTTAEGWGTYSQRRAEGRQTSEVLVRWGRLALRTVALEVPGAPAKVRVSVLGQDVPAEHVFANGRVTVSLAHEAILTAGQALVIELG